MMCERPGVRASTVRASNETRRGLIMISNSPDDPGRCEDSRAAGGRLRGRCGAASITVLSIFAAFAFAVLLAWVSMAR